MPKKYIVLVIVLLILGGGVFTAWRFWPQEESSTVVLREDLPPAPANYKTLQENPIIVAELPAEIQKKYRDGFEEAWKFIDEHPESFAGWYDLGSIKSVFGDYKGAEDAWLYATAISPNQARSLMNLGDLYWNKTKNYEKAEWAYNSVFDRGSAGLAERTRAYRDLASLYRFSYIAKRDEAFVVLRAGITDEIVEDNSELLALAAQWAWEDSKLDEAIGFYEKFLIKNPNQEQAQKDLEQIRRQKAGN